MQLSFKIYCLEKNKLFLNYHGLRRLPLREISQPNSEVDTESPYKETLEELFVRDIEFYKQVKDGVPLGEQEPFYLEPSLRNSLFKAFSTLFSSLLPDLKISVQVDIFLKFNKTSLLSFNHSITQIHL